MLEILIGLLVILAIIGYVMRNNIVTAISPRPKTLGLQNGKLAPCPSFDNCVNSDATSPKHKIEPIVFTGMSQAQAQERLMTAIKSLPRAEIITSVPGYVYVELRSPQMGFIDDAEFVIGENSIGLRSASRIGRGDMGVNCRNMELIRAAFMK